MKAETIVEELKKDLRPSKEALREAQDFVFELSRALKKSGLEAESMLGGSVAKGTHTKGRFDADIFIRFDCKYKDKDISKLLNKVLKQMKLKFSVVHGSRDYFQVRNKFLYELVPVLHVTDPKLAMNVVDMSPLHVDYFIKKTKRSEKMKDEVRLTKTFMRAARVYGAESYIKGFSGHVVDLLIIHYGSFLKLVREGAKWKPKVIIDLEKHHDDALMTLNASKTGSHLIIVDPVQKERNAAAAVSKESFAKFQETCRKFIKNPGKDFFERCEFIEILAEKRKKLGSKNDFFELNIVPLKGKDDVVGSKVLKIKEHLESGLQENDFELAWSDFEFDEKKSAIALAVKKGKLSEEKIIKGPPTEMKQNSIDFKKKHKRTFIKSNIIYATEKRRYRTPDSLLKELLESKYVMERCKKICFQKII